MSKMSFGTPNKGTGANTEEASATIVHVIQRPTLSSARDAAVRQAAAVQARNSTATPASARAADSRIVTAAALHPPANTAATAAAASRDTSNTHVPTSGAAGSSSPPASSTNVLNTQALPGKPAGPLTDQAGAPAPAPQLPEGVSIFDVTNAKSADGMIEVTLKPLQVHRRSPAGGIQPQLATGHAPAKPSDSLAANASPAVCIKPDVSSHEVDIGFTAGQNGVSQTTLSASCAAAASPTAATLGSGCSVKCDLEEDLEKITLVASRDLTAAADGKPRNELDQPAVCRYGWNCSLLVRFYESCTCATRAASSQALVHMCMGY